MLTIFTSPKPFTGQIARIQKNALGSWRKLGPAVEILLIGDEEGMAEAAQEFEVRHIPAIERNEQGTPLISAIFETAEKLAKHSILCFANADILFFDDLLPAVSEARAQFERFLIIGQRWDLDVGNRLSFENGWQEQVHAEIHRIGNLHPPAGSDYFVFPRALFNSIPPFALGRAGWDNWMIYAARAAKTPVLDATARITAVHQSHDYAHLPDGKAHYNLPESVQNVVLAGGQNTIFTIRDANWRLSNTGIQRRSWIGRGALRSIETAAISRLGPGAIIHFLFHPVEVIRYYAERFLGRLSNLVGTRNKRDKDPR